ncbi:Mamu class II histocompatibility antigen, DR alpha chain [Chelonia mydas]|uniref:Mamu class II histocompatibility antigen, DR alpha chain n=1 Tax=Chelonia mydas TaxID=8469 RepID=M7BNN9_CHEMY|nr:Mamu class II histocompatibility antigen, DR alpha chain [Chelonia mydas]
MTWLKNGQEVTGGVSETDFYPRQDNSFRKFSYLPFLPSQGDFYDCQVEHWGLPEPFTKHWEVQVPTPVPETTETLVCALGLAVGIIGIIAGTILIIKGMKMNAARNPRQPLGPPSTPWGDPPTCCAPPASHSPSSTQHPLGSVTRFAHDFGVCSFIRVTLLGGGGSVILSMYCLCHLCVYMELCCSLLQVPSQRSDPAGPRFPGAGFLQTQTPSEWTGSISTFNLPPLYAPGLVVWVEQHFQAASLLSPRFSTSLSPLSRHNCSGRNPLDEQTPRYLGALQGSLA